LRYRFDWDPRKASINARRHTINFRHTTTVFRDPRHLSVYDEEHSEDEDRWITLGIAGEGTLLVVVHTFEQMDEENVSVRIISARKATASEIAQYYEEVSQ